MKRSANGVVDLICLLMKSLVSTIIVLNVRLRFIYTVATSIKKRKEENSFIVYFERHISSLAKSQVF